MTDEIRIKTSQSYELDLKKSSPNEAVFVKKKTQCEMLLNELYEMGTIPLSDNIDKNFSELYGYEL